MHAHLSLATKAHCSTSSLICSPAMSCFSNSRRSGTRKTEESMFPRHFDAWTMKSIDACLQFNGKQTGNHLQLDEESPLPQYLKLSDGWINRLLHFAAKSIIKKLESSPIPTKVDNECTALSTTRSSTS